MATVTQLSSGSIYTGTTVNLTGVSVEPGDFLALFMSSYATLGVSSISNLGNIQMSNNYGIRLTGPSPDLWVDSWFGFQTSTVASTTISVNFSSSRPAAVIAFRVRPDTNKQLFLRSRDVNSSQTLSTVRSIATSAPVTSDSILIGSFGVGDDTFFTDSDTLNGSWSAVFYAGNSVGTSDLAVFGQSKIVTGSGQQTYGGTFPGSEYAAGFLLHLYEIGFPYWGVLNK